MANIRSAHSNRYDMTMHVTYHGNRRVRIREFNNITVVQIGDLTQYMGLSHPNAAQLVFTVVRVSPIKVDPVMFKRANT